jgi:hypothetical protein
MEGEWRENGEERVVGGTERRFEILRQEKPP